MIDKTDLDDRVVYIRTTVVSTVSFPSNPRPLADCLRIYKRWAEATAEFFLQESEIYQKAMLSVRACEILEGQGK